jgi:UDP-N-acetylglucosamine 2-epimerase (non-hydrolysing)
MPGKLVVHVVGARPNYMKVAPVYAALERRGNVEQRLVHTGQHYDALLKDVFFAELPLPKPQVQLDARTTESAFEQLERTFGELRPDLVVVAGDVNTTLAGAAAAHKWGIPVAHIESGLRSRDWSMPEEVNRVITDHISSLLLTHSEEANQNLAGEHLPEERVVFVGNTMIDTLLQSIEAARALEAWSNFGLARGKYILVTLHRHHLFETPGLIERAIEALDSIAESVPVIFPAHPRTRAAIETSGVGYANIKLVEPLPYGHFLSLEADAAGVITDSGGVPEETTVLGVRCFTLRDQTERPVTVTLGTNTILGQDPEAIRRVPDLLLQERAWEIPPLWDGHAGERAAEAIEEAL